MNGFLYDWKMTKINEHITKYCLNASQGDSLVFCTITKTLFTKYIKDIMQCVRVCVRAHVQVYR